jgi:hypothetical protein
MNSASRGLWPTVGLRRPKNTLRVGEGRRPARKRLGRPISIGAKADARRGVRRMNSASRGLWPTVGLRRPKNTLRVGEGRRLARKRLRRPISIGAKRPAWGAPNEFGQGPVGQRSACADRKILSASAKADAWRASASEGRFQSARRPSASGRLYASNEFDLEGPSANGRPTPTEKSALRVGEGRRLARKRLGRPISIGAKAFGQRSACADRKILFASAKADARRVAP